MHTPKTTSTREAMKTFGAVSLSVYLRQEVTVLYQKVDHAAAALATAVTPSAVHNARVAARRLRVLLQAYREYFDAAAAKRFKRGLRQLTRELEGAREAEVTRRAIAELTRSPHTMVANQSRALRARAATGYDLAVSRLRLSIAAMPWRQRLVELRGLSVRSSLVKDNKALAVKVTNRLAKRRRRRLRNAVRHAGNPKRLHRIRLKVKALRYFLETCLSTAAIRKNAELRRLRDLQDCLGELHDAENLRKTLQAEHMRHNAARAMGDQLEAKKRRLVHQFKSHRNGLIHLWRRGGVAGVTLRRTYRC